MVGGLDRLRRSAALWVAFALFALLARALVPPGYMLATGPSGSMHVSLCSGQGVVDVWVDARGQTHERVYDVIWSEPGKRKLRKGHLTPVGDTVDLATATYRNTIGASELHAVWRDPDFKPGEHAFYYARVLEIPTPRWIVYDHVRFGTKITPEMQPVAQERAYSSPVWYSPAGQTAGLLRRRPIG